MAARKKKAYWYRYRRQWYLRGKGYKRVSANSFKVKLDTVCTLKLVDAGFGFSSPDATDTYLFHTLIEQCPDWKTYSSLFHTFKMTGLRIKVTPSINHLRANGGVSGSYGLAVVTNRENRSWASISEANKNCMMSLYQRTGFYIPYGAGITGYMSCDNLGGLDGKVIVDKSPNATHENVDLEWTVQFRFYMIFKNAV